MKINKIHEFLIALQKWHSGEIDIQPILTLLGDDYNDLGKMLMSSGYADFGYKPMDGYTFQEIVNAVLIYLAMRHGLKTEGRGR